MYSPEPLHASDDICQVSAGWSYTALVTRGGRVELSGSVSGAADGCRDVWASEELLVLLRNKGGSSTEVQAWVPGSALQGEPLWVQNLVSGAKGQGEDEPSRESRMGTLPLLPCARAYVTPEPPFCQPLAPGVLLGCGQAWTAGPRDSGGRTRAKTVGGTAGPADG